MKALVERERRRRELRATYTPKPITCVPISCSKSKLNNKAPARELYTGQLFKKAVAWAERHGHHWFVISALHGLLRPDQELDPYNVSDESIVLALPTLTVTARAQASLW